MTTTETATITKTEIDTDDGIMHGGKAMLYVTAELADLRPRKLRRLYDDVETAREDAGRLERGELTFDGWYSSGRGHRVD